MKSITLFWILIGLILISSTRCSKEAKGTDYRDAFLGDYDFTISAFHFDLTTDSVYKDSIYQFSGYIAKSDNSPSAILLFYKPNFNIVANLSPNGSLDKIYGFGIGWNLNGKFCGVDSLRFRFGGIYVDSVTGIRKKQSS